MKTRSEILQTAAVEAFHSHRFIHANKWEVVISSAVILEIYHQTAETSSARFLQQGHTFSRVPDCQMLLWFLIGCLLVYFFSSQASLKSDFLDVKICKNLWQNPRRKLSQRTAALSLLTRQKNHLVREDLDPRGQTLGILFNVICWADFNSMMMLVLVRWHEFVPFYYLL